MTDYTIITRLCHDHEQIIIVNYITLHFIKYNLSTKVNNVLYSMVRVHNLSLTYTILYLPTQLGHICACAKVNLKNRNCIHVQTRSI